MTTPSTDISKYNTTDETSAVTPAYAAGLFGALMASQGGNGKLPHIYEYETPGTYSVTVPEGVNAMLVLGAAAGGGGGGTSSHHENIASGGAGGSIVNKVYPVTPGRLLSIVIGKGGASTSSGTATTIKHGSDTLVSLTGGGGATNGQNAGRNGTPNAQCGTVASGADVNHKTILDNDATYVHTNPVPGGNNLIGLGGSGADRNASTRSAAIRGGGGHSRGVSSGNATGTAGSGGDGYLCFIFVNYDFEMSRGGGV